MSRWRMVVDYDNRSSLGVMPRLSCEGVHTHDAGYPRHGIMDAPDKPWHDDTMEWLRRATAMTEKPLEVP